LAKVQHVLSEFNLNFALFIGQLDVNEIKIRRNNMSRRDMISEKKKDDIVRFLYL
jgi:hypothetical protein